VSPNATETQAAASGRTDIALGHGLAGAQRAARAAFLAWRSRLEPTMAGRVWKQLSELDVMTSSLQFAAMFTLGFIPFLMALSAVLGSGLSRAIIIRGGFNATAGHDVTMLFAHGRTAPASLTVLGLVWGVVGGAAISHMLQTWYAKIFLAELHRWKAMARRAEWLAGVAGFVMLEVVIGRRIEPLSGPIAAAGVQFLLAVAFWWWSLHCLLSGQIPWRRLFPAGLATAVCYTGLTVYIAYVMSSSIVSNVAMYGLIGAVTTLISAEIGLGVALQLGAAVGATIGRGKDPTTSGRADPGPHVSQLTAHLGPAIPTRPQTRMRRPDTDD
jgi:membrane protein